MNNGGPQHFLRRLRAIQRRYELLERLIRQTRSLHPYMGALWLQKTLLEKTMDDVMAMRPIGGKWVGENQKECSEQRKRKG